MWSMFSSRRNKLRKLQHEIEVLETAFMNLARTMVHLGDEQQAQKQEMKRMAANLTKLAAAVQKLEDVVNGLPPDNQADLDALADRVNVVADKLAPPVVPPPEPPPTPTP